MIFFPALRTLLNYKGCLIWIQKENYFCIIVSLFRMRNLRLYKVWYHTTEAKKKDPCLFDKHFFVWCCSLFVKNITQLFPKPPVAFLLDHWTLNISRFLTIDVNFEIFNSNVQNFCIKFIHCKPRSLDQCRSTSELLHWLVFVTCFQINCVFAVSCTNHSLQ